MAGSLNKVQLIGRLGADPEIKQMVNGKNCLAYDDRLSTYLLCPSAYIVSKANEDFPDPDRPVITTNFSLGISRETFFRLCSLAPFTTIFFNIFFTLINNHLMFIIQM